MLRGVITIYNQQDKMQRIVFDKQEFDIQFDSNLNTNPLQITFNVSLHPGLQNTNNIVVKIYALRSESKELIGTYSLGTITIATKPLLTSNATNRISEFITLLVEVVINTTILTDKITLKYYNSNYGWLANWKNNTTITDKSIVTGQMFIGSNNNNVLNGIYIGSATNIGTQQLSSGITLILNNSDVFKLAYDNNAIDFFVGNSDSYIYFNSLTGQVNIKGDIEVQNTDDFVLSGELPLNVVSGQILYFKDSVIDKINGSAPDTITEDDAHLLYIKGLVGERSLNVILNIYGHSNDKTYIDGGKIYTNSITANQIDSENLFTKYFTLKNGGAIRSEGKTGYSDNNTGIWLDKTKFEIYHNTGNYLRFDSTAGTLTIKGDVLGGLKTNSDDLSNTGFYFGTDGKIIIGNSSNYIQWDNSLLRVKGVIEAIGSSNVATVGESGLKLPDGAILYFDQSIIDSLTGLLPAGVDNSDKLSISLAGFGVTQLERNIATLFGHSSDITKIDGGKIFTNSITASQIDADNLFTKYFTIKSGGVIRSEGKTDYGNNTAGIWLDKTRFEIYRDANNYLRFDASSGTLTIKGDIYANNGSFSGTVTATSGSIGGITIGSNKLYIGNGNYNNTDTLFYVDNTGKLSLKNKLAWDGSSLTVEGTINATGGTITGSMTVGLTITLGKDVGGTNKHGIKYNNHNYWYLNTGTSNLEFQVGSSSSYVQFDGTNLNIKSNILGGSKTNSSDLSNAGFYFGTDGKMVIGNSTNYIQWNGSTLTIQGTLKLSNGTNVDTLISNAQTNAVNEVKAMYNYPNSTLIDGGKIYAGTITLDKISNYLNTNSIDTSSWIIESGTERVLTGKIGIFNLNQDAIGENLLVEGINPYGKRDVLWECRPSGNNNPDGGWNSDYLPADPRKMYRFVVFVKRNSFGNGTTYFGTNLDGTITDLNGNVNSNPYFFYGSNFGIPDKWYMIVSYVLPYNATWSDVPPDAGVYSVESGWKVSNVNVFKFKDLSVRWLMHRLYLFYTSSSSVRQQFWGPRIDEVNGNEPSLETLMFGSQTIPNRWVAKLYPIGTNHWFGAEPSKYWKEEAATMTVYAHDNVIASRNGSNVTNNGLLIFGDRHYYIAKLTTYVYVSGSVTLNNMIFATDDPGELFVNGVRIFHSPQCQNNTISFTLNTGWNKIEIYYWEGYGQHGATLVRNDGTPLSKLVEKMQLVPFGATQITWNDIATNNVFTNTIQIGVNGNIRTINKSGYLNGEGVFIGYDPSDQRYKLDVGNNSNYIRWDGNKLNVSGIIVLTAILVPVLPI